VTNYAFSTLTLLDGYQEEHVACKQVLANTNRLYEVLCGYVTLHRVTLNRATVKRRHFNGRQLTGATFKRSDR